MGIDSSVLAIYAIAKNHGTYDDFDFCFFYPVFGQMVFSCPPAYFDDNLYAGWNSLDSAHIEAYDSSAMELYD